MSREVLHIGVRELGGTRVLSLTGELDSYTSERLTTVSKMWVPGATKVIVNLNALEYIDSSGLSALVGMWVMARDVGTEMIVSCHNPRIHRVLEITGLLNLFQMDNPVTESRVSTDIGYGRTIIEKTNEASDQVEPRISPKDMP